MAPFLITDSHYEAKILIHRHSLEQLASSLIQLGKIYSQVVLISTPIVFELYGRRIKQQLKQIQLPVAEILIAEGESAKTLQEITKCWEQMAALGLDRQSLVIGLGGGVATDVAGFAASCYMRGLDVVLIPTTLLGMVDAAIGGKTGINFAHNKNLIGTYHTPKLVLIDPTCLTTLPLREFNAGLAEIIKYGIISDIVLFEELEKQIESLRQGDLSLLEEVIYRSCKIKFDIVCQDFKDAKDIRSHLNYGHTFAHALEALTLYQDYLHGEAVAIGMSCAARLSYRMNLVDRLFVERQDAVCLKAGLPIDFPSTVPIDPLIELMKGDKKAVGRKINLILPQKIGKVFKVSDINPDLIKQTLLTKDVNSLERIRSSSLANSYSVSRLN